MKTQPTLLYSLLLLATSGCIRCGGLRSESPAPVTFYLVEANGGNTSSAAYNPDSLRLTLDNEPFNYLFAGKDETLGLPIFETYPVLYNKTKVRMLLHLSSHNTDTLDIAYTVRRGDCYTDYTYSGFFLNGRELKQQPDTGYLQLPVL